MAEGDVGATLHDTILVVLKLGGPSLLAALAVGVLMSLVQAVTQVNEATLAFLPKAAAIVATLALTGSFMLALPMAGQVISFMLGLSSVVVPDPVLGQSSAAMKLFALAAPVLVLGSGLWRLPVAALAESYALAPPGQALPLADTMQAALGAAAGAFGLAVQLAAPFVLASVVWQVALGLLARLIPQLQVYFAALPGQLLGGLALLAVLATGLVDSWMAAARDGFAALPGL